MSAPCIGLLGGSFDPVHRAHLELAHRALQQVPLDEVWLVPTATNPLKPEGATAVAADRVAMLKLVLADEPRLRLSMTEIERGGAAYSVDTVKSLCRDHPDYTWYFVMGEDLFRQIDRWRQPAELFRLAPPVVCPRPGFAGDRSSSRFGARVRWLTGPPLDLSSTVLRAALAAGQHPEGLTEPVYQYILEHRLYRGDGSG